jgi:hypothetical protein
MSSLQAPMHVFAQRCTNSDLDALFAPSSTLMHATGLKVATHSFTRCFKTRNLRTHNRSQIRADCISRNFCYEKQSILRLIQKVSICFILKIRKTKGLSYIFNSNQ